MSEFFNTLLESTQDVKQQLFEVPQITAALQGKISLQNYLDYLEQAYHHVKHTVPLLMAAGSRFPAEKEFLREAIVEYVQEEVGHQEWILNDINNAGGNAEKVRHGEPNMATEIMVAYAYDTIARHNPVGFFGMVFVLEGTSILLATQAANTLQKSLGLDANAFSYLSSHGELDQSHMKFFEKLMNRLDNSDDRQAVLHVAKRMFVLFANVFRSIPFETETRQ